MACYGDSFTFICEHTIFINSPENFLMGKQAFGLITLEIKQTTMKYTSYATFAGFDCAPLWGETSSNGRWT
jgi:hypothetical protein